MARGWESKSIEAQQEEAAEKDSSSKPHRTPGETARLREKESLRLSLRNITEQLTRTRNERRRAVLEQARTDLELRLDKLGA
jgi:hypothetical protein